MVTTRYFSEVSVVSQFITRVGIMLLIFVTKEFVVLYKIASEHLIVSAI